MTKTVRQRWREFMQLSLNEKWLGIDVSRHKRIHEAIHGTWCFAWSPLFNKARVGSMAFGSSGQQQQQPPGQSFQGPGQQYPPININNLINNYQGGSPPGGPSNTSGSGGGGGGASPITAYLAQTYGAQVLTPNSGTAIPVNVAHAVLQTVGPQTLTGQPVSPQVFIAGFNKALVQ